MAFLQFKEVGMTHLAAAVPRNTIHNYQYTAYFPKEEVKEVVDKIGVTERRFAPEGICASDLCEAAANAVFSTYDINKADIDLLVFVSQTPDYRMPATAVLLQHRLGLSTHTMAFDVSLGCSGFVYGLSLVYSLMEHSGLKKALLLDGETRSRVYSPKDRKTAFLFGDAGVAAIIERRETFNDSFFSLQTDGSKESLIKIDAGGYRHPSSPETVEEKTVDAFGNIRSDEQAHMNGAEVFNFILSHVPENIRHLLQEANVPAESIDYWVFHQANSFMNGYLVKKLKIPPEKALSCIAEFGNTSSVSIPLTIATTLKENVRGTKNWLLSGFGVGMSWGSAVIRTYDLKIPALVEI
jgi:3-oxoacyl-[acyl-carrier-protein] synthase-3